MTSIAAATQPEHAPGRRRSRGCLRALRGPAICGVVAGTLQTMSPLAFWWLEPKTVYALGTALIAAIYIGFSVADGRWHVIAIESIVAGFFVVVAARDLGPCLRLHPALGALRRWAKCHGKPEGAVLPMTE